MEVIVNSYPEIQIVHKSSLTRLAGLIGRAQAVVAVDTGLAHLAAAMARPCVSLYLVTSPLLTGCYGTHQVHLARQGQETPYIKKQLTPGISSPIVPVYFDAIPDDWAVYQHLQPYLV